MEIYFWNGMRRLGGKWRFRGLDKASAELGIGGAE
jgi:hypothetical protein